MKAINRNQLFAASCMAFLVTSLSFGIRTGILNRLSIPSYMIFMGGYYDLLIGAKLPECTELYAYANVEAVSKLANIFNEVKKAAGPEIINITLLIPFFIIVVFIVLKVYIISRKRKEVLLTA